MLIALALHSLVSNRTAVAFVPPGMKSVAPVPLAPDARRGLALRQMEAALGSEKDVLLAVDGPIGRRHRIAPGAMWLAGALKGEGALDDVGDLVGIGMNMPRQNGANRKGSFAR
jgi:hypothetical protein